MNRDNPEPQAKEPHAAPRKPARRDRWASRGGKSHVERDAEGQFAGAKKGSTNDGVASADPRVLSGKESGDATWPLKQGRAD